MIPSENSTICGLRSWVGIVRNDTATYINNILLATVNVPCAIFAFLSNLAIIVTIIKKPSLQKPCIILLCSLAFADCLTGVTAQPILVVWRFVLQRAQQSCLHQLLIFDVYATFNRLLAGLSFVNIVMISFDCYYALSKPLVYHCTVTNKAMVVVIIGSNIWVLCSMLLQFVLPNPVVNYIIGVSFEVLFVLVPIVNYIRMWFAIRRHNSQLGAVVASQQMPAVFQREKKVALDMCIVAIVLLASLAPFISMEIVKMLDPRLHPFVLPWALTMVLIPSTINPWIYFGRNQTIRNAVKSMMHIQLKFKEL